MKNLLFTTLILCSCLFACKAPQTSVSKPAVTDPAKLGGDWELDYISGRRIAFNGLYPERKPHLKFDIPKNELHGNTSCNGFSSKLTIDGNKISIAEPMAMTMMACPGEGEKAFLDMLKKVNKYDVTGDTTLTFIMDDIAVMRFHKK